MVVTNSRQKRGGGGAQDLVSDLDLDGFEMFLYQNVYMSWAFVPGPQTLKKMAILERIQLLKLLSGVASLGLAL